MLMSMISFNAEIMYAQSLPDPGSIIFDNEPGEEAPLERLDTGTAAEKIKTLVIQRLLPITKYIFISFGIFFFVYYGIKMIISTEEENITTQRHNMLWAGVGFALLGIMNHVVEALNPGGQAPDTIGSATASEFAFRDLIIYIELFVGAIATFFITLAAMRIIVSQGDQDELNRQKTNFTWGLIGLAVIMLSEVSVQIAYIYQNRETSPGKATDAVLQIAGVINFMLGIVGILAVLTLVIGGIYYVSSFGDEERSKQAKNIVYAAVIAIAIIVTSYAFVSTLMQP